MPLFLAKACPECGGDCEWDDAEKEWCCFQGGHRFSQEKMKRIVEKANEKKRAQIAPPQAPERHGRRGGRKNPLTEYYEKNKEQIIADAKTLGETATRKKWGIKSGAWTNLKKRWGLPMNRWGYAQGDCSVLPPRQPIAKAVAKEVDIKTSPPVELIPIPPRAHPWIRSSMKQYYEDNKEQIIAEARYYGECDTRKRWGIESGVWTRLKYRWKLPVNKRGQRMAKSGLPRAAEAGPSPSSKRPKRPRKRRDITAKPVGPGVIALGKILCDLSGLSNRDALLVLHQAERHIHQQRNGGKGSTLGPDAWTLPLSTIVNICADSFGFTADDLKSHRREKRLVVARQVAMYVSHETGNFSMIEIGQALDGKDHATVSHGVNNIKKKLKEGDSSFLKQTIKEIIAQL